LLQARNIHKYYGGDGILLGASFQVNPGEKIGLIGVNGSGKTTLFRILSGSLEPDGGELIFDRHRRVGMLSQEVTVKGGNTLREEMERAMPHLAEMEGQLRLMEEEMAGLQHDPGALDGLVREYAALHEKFVNGGGLDLSWKIDSVIQGLGFSISDGGRDVSQFSGGWQMRIELARLLLQDVDLLLLDEPTNHLDLKAVEWLEEYLGGYRGAVIIISHDRYFLNRVTGRTLHLQGGRLKSYNGNYDHFSRARQEEEEQHRKAYGEQQRQMQKDERFITRFRAKATLATRVKSREKMLEKREMIEAPAGRERGIKLSFASDERDMTTVFQLQDLSKAYPGMTVSLLGRLEICRGDRIAVMGENGSGKTTLLKMLAGMELHHGGRLHVHNAARIQFYMQNQAEQLNPDNTVLEELEAAAPALSKTALRTVLGCFLFRGDDVFKQVPVLSGGEKSRLALALMVTSPSNVLLLDEPTNHLDIESREALAQALESYAGTLVIVSHDRYFVQQVCNRIVEIEDGCLLDYEGDYEYYLHRKRRKEDASRPAPARPGRKAPGRRPPAPPGREQLLRAQISTLEEEISRLEESLKNLETEMELPENIADPVIITRLSREYAGAKRELESRLDTWEELCREAGA
jgi:ATP-binding cassette subfamily F protein 3